MSTLSNFITNLSNLTRRDASRWRPWARTALALAALMALLALAQPGLTSAQGGWPLVGGTVTVINAGPGDQVDAHISGTLVAYTSINAGFSDVRYRDLLTGADSAIPQTEVSLDYLPDIDGSMIVYTHITSDAYETNLFDTRTAGSPITLDPQPGSQRERPAIGGRTVAWVDFGPEWPYQDPEIYVYDLFTDTATRLTDDSFYDTDPDVSPDGSTVVWAACQVYESGCRIWQATRSDGGWSAAQLPGDGERKRPSVDDRFIVYEGNDAGEEDIYWRERGSNVEHRISLPDLQRDPSVSNGLVVFESFDRTDPATANWEIMLYDLTTGAGYQVTDSVVDEVLPDVALGSDGLVSVVYMAQLVTEADVYVRTFSLPSADATPPSITISAPTDTTYALNQGVLADYSCSDESGGSGLATCAGPVASGSPIDTATVGLKTFTVTAADNAGNTASQSVSYTVAYNICVLYDQGKTHKLGSTVPIKLQLCDADAANVSAPDVIVHASGLTKLDNSASGDLADTSNANPDNDFRFDAALGGNGGYIYNLGTRGLSTGTWTLQFTASGDPVIHSVQFDLR